MTRRAIIVAAADNDTVVYRPCYPDATFAPEISYVPLALDAEGMPRSFDSFFAAKDVVDEYNVGWQMDTTGQLWDPYLSQWVLD